MGSLCLVFELWARILVRSSLGPEYSAPDFSGVLLSLVGVSVALIPFFVHRGFLDVPLTLAGRLPTIM